ncbi:MAG: hypothetical protein J1E62_02775 [Lachnospiraceae bacterium]|nr:hypothetical protein [Lachnospiraceae bacterium]
MKINHNISAQLANVNLKKIDTRLSASLQRLSSGYKINKAADDSAGMAISNKMRTQIKALDRAGRNALDGDSIIQTAEGAMTEIENMLQRIRELGVQSANDTLALEDRQAIQKEVDDLLDEIDRISRATEFNGKGLLDGSSSRTTMTNSLAIRSISASMDVPLGEYTITVEDIAMPAKNSLSYDIPSVVSINGYTIEIGPDESVQSVNKRLIEICDSMGIDAEASGTSLELTTRAKGSAQQIAVRSAGEEEVDFGDPGIDAVINLGDEFAPEDSFSYSASGALITIVGSGGFEMQIDTSNAEGGEEGIVRVEDAGYMVLQIGANEHQTLEMDIYELTCQSLSLRDIDGVNQINACTQAGATHMISKIDEAISKVSEARSTLGAFQNRLDSTRASLDISVENLTDSMSRIMDTDMASEMTEYTQRSVLSQAASSMLAQANNRPQEIMALMQS